MIVVDTDAQGNTTPSPTKAVCFQLGGHGCSVIWPKETACELSAPTDIEPKHTLVINVSEATESGGSFEQVFKVAYKTKGEGAKQSKNNELDTKALDEWFTAYICAADAGAIIYRMWSWRVFGKAAAKDRSVSVLVSVTVSVANKLRANSGKEGVFVWRNHRGDEAALEAERSAEEAIFFEKDATLTAALAISNSIAGHMGIIAIKQRLALRFPAERELVANGLMLPTNEPLPPWCRRRTA